MVMLGRWEGAKPFPEDGVTPPLERREEGKKAKREKGPIIAKLDNWIETGHL